ncbi:SNF2 domain-containing protein / helicase domain-containing protein / zinc finger protein-related [Euphorbia peplus]|nr:SNF2 domain-containing protein / helicase domain-containing protein / zinc finger protein-related [Euphorbia peplus]
MDTIDISSDSDNGIDVEEIDDDFSDFDDSDDSSERPSTNSRILPSWAGAAGSNSRITVNGGRAGRANSPTIHASNGSSLNANKPSTSGGIRASNQPTSQANDSLYSLGNGNRGQPRTVNSRISNVSGTDYEKISSQQAFNRTVPPSNNQSSTNSKSNNLPESASSSQTRDIYSNTYHPAGPSVTHNKGYMRDYYGKGVSEDVMMYDNNGGRTLPPSMMQGKSNPSPSFGPSDPLYRPMAGEERVTGEDERLIYQAALEDLNQPKVEVNPPDGLLSVSLLRHQKIALAWMLQKETRSLHCLGGILADDQGLGKTISMIALIQTQKYLESKTKSGDQSKSKPEALNLDDDDDNGRSGLIEVKQAGESDDIKPILEVGTSSRTFSRKRPAAGTLVVCPASVLRQWARELEDKVDNEAKLSVLLYHGGTRTKDPVELAKYDVVLTTYAIVTNEVPKQPIVDEEEADEDKDGLSSEFSISNKRKKKTANVSKKKKKGQKGIDGVDYDSGALARVAWFRVILDEAQTIKNHRTQVARACCSLRAKRRWCLSGTPIQNTIDDLYSYFRFLRYDPYAVYKSFYSTIKVPISRNSVHGYKKLQAVLRAIMLRRTKGTLIDGQPIIKLPPKSICLMKVDFSQEERNFYTRLEADSRSKFKAYAAAGTVSQNYANILLMLLRLRQACDHPLLIKGSSVSDSVGKVSADMAKRLPEEMVLNLLDCLASSSAICQVCNDIPEDSIVTMCGHVFCYQCVSDFLTGDENECPARGCKEQLGTDIVFSEDTLKSRMSDNQNSGAEHSESDGRSIVLHNEYSSSKIKAVVDILLSHRQKKSSDPELEGPIKTIIFSQWTGMLDLVQASLKHHRMDFRRLDGTMSLIARDKAVKDFNNDPKVTVMIMSLKAGNLGLNMVAACHVILLDLWWNPTTEDQAIDRAHRIGQTRPVTVTRLTIKDTVEDRILALQEEKRRMVASAFGEDHSGGSATRLTVEDLKYLFMGSSAPRG